MKLVTMEKSIYNRKKILLNNMKDVECYIQNIVIKEFIGKISHLKIYDRESNITTKVLIELI